MTRLAAAGYAVSIETVPHEFQRGGHQMMRVKAAGEAKDCWNRSTTMVEDSPPGFYELGAV
jgi:hypothetical protein